MRPRALYPDILRVAAALGVILLHVINPTFVDTNQCSRALWWVLCYINEAVRTCVPLFFMLSGALLLPRLVDGRESLGVFYRKRFSKLWMPFLFWSLLYFFLARWTAGAPLFTREALTSLVSDLFRTGTEYHLWYLYSLAILYLALPFLGMALSRCGTGTRWLLLALLLWQPTIKPFFNTLLTDKLWIFFAEDGVVGYFGYAVLGYLLATEVPVWLRRLLITLGGVSFLLIPLWNGQSILADHSFLWNGGYTINHYLEAAAVFLLAQSLFPASAAERHPGLTKVTVFLSSCTFTVYLAHVLILEHVARIFTPTLTALSPSGVMLTEFALTAFLSFLLAAAWHLLLRLFAAQK